MLKTTFSDVENLLLNMSAGLQPKDLTQDEVNLLIDKYGINWFEELGYSEPKFEKPKFNMEND